MAPPNYPSIDHFCNGKYIDPKQLPEAVEQLRRQGKSIATLNGSFDLLHAGHLHIIYEAAQSADTLIVALNSDHSIKGYKGPERPYIPLDGRRKMMAALAFVDYVTWFDEATPISLLKTIQPDIHVNGSEYGHDCIEAKTVEAGGGKIQVVTLIPGLSTSTIVERIRQTSEHDTPCA